MAGEAARGKHHIVWKGRFYNSAIFKLNKTEGLAFSGCEELLSSVGPRRLGF